MYFPLFLSMLPMVSFGIGNVLLAKISRKLNPFYGGFLVQFFALVATFFISPLFLKFPININLSAFVVLGAMSAGIYLLLCRSLSKGKVSIVTPIIASSSLVTAILGMVFLGESAGIFKILSILLVIIGVILISLNLSEVKKGISFFSPGVRSAILVAFGLGVYFFFLGPISKDNGWFITTLANRLVSTAFLGAFLFVKEKKLNLFKIKIPWKFMIPMIIVEIVGFTGYNFAVSMYEVSYVYVIANSSPLVSVIIASVFMGEKTSWLQKVGIMVVISGIISLQLVSG